MKPTAPPTITAAQWLAVLAIWAAVTYGAMAAPKAEVGRAPVNLVACR